MESEFVVDEETAKADVDRWLKANRIRIERPGMDENESRDLKEDVQAIVQETMEGRIEIDDSNKLTFKPEDCDPLTFNRPRAGGLKKLDNKKEHAKMAQMVLLLSVVTGTSESTISELHSNDLLMAATIASLFLVR